MPYCRRQRGHPLKGTLVQQLPYKKKHRVEHGNPSVLQNPYFSSKIGYVRQTRVPELGFMLLISPPVPISSHASCNGKTPLHIQVSK